MNYYTNSRPEMQALLPEKATKILDVGCGAAEFGASLKRNRCLEVWGVEPVVDAAKHAIAKIDKVIHAKFEAGIDLPIKYFDAIFFNDVLEHMSQPEEALRLAKLFLSKNGVIIISVPNFRHFDNLFNLVFKKDAKYLDFGIMDYTHLRVFTKKSVVRMVMDCGLHPITAKGVNGGFVSPKYYLALIFSLGLSFDTKWLQYAVVATVNNEDE